MNDAGLVETDGRDNPTSLDIQKSFSIVNQNSAAISSWRVPPARVAMVYDLQSDLVNRLDLTNLRDGDYVGRYETFRKFPEVSAYTTSLQGTYQLFWLRNIQADIVSSKRLEEVMG